MFVCIQIWVKTLDSTSEIQKNIQNIIFNRYRIIKNIILVITSTVKAAVS